jgi:hypothetical protein
MTARNNPATSNKPDTEDTGRDPTTGRFLTENNVGPGRPRGSRNKLTTEFLDALYVNSNRAAPRRSRRSQSESPQSI